MVQQLTTVDRFNIVVKFLSASQKNGKKAGNSCDSHELILCSGEGHIQVLGREDT